MAERRMFCKSVIESDDFLDMPSSSQLLYFHLSMRADDDGFVNNPKSIMRNVRSTEDDLKVLITKKYILPFESGVVVIRHWKLHNYIQKDRYRETNFKDEKALLNTKSNKEYELKPYGNNNFEILDTERIQNVYALDTQSSLSQDRLMIDRLYINYNKRDFDFENFAYEDKQNITKVFENCELGFSDLETGKNNNLITDVQLKRFDFLRDILLDIYFSSNRFILSKVNYQILCFIENKCLSYENVENYFNYFKTALINKLIENTGGFNNG